MSAWARGMAALYLGEWPCHVLAADAPRLRATVRFLGGDAPAGSQAEAVVSLARLVRPRLPKWLDRPAMRHWTSKANLWTGAELRRLRAEAAVKPLSVVAASLGRSEKSCEIAGFRWFGSKVPHTDKRMTSRRVARILDVDDHRVTRLIAEGSLRASRSGTPCGLNEKWAVRDVDLDDFLYRHPERYDWRQVEAGRWRDRAEAIHSADPLLDVAEVGRRLGLGPNAITQRIRWGRLAAVWSDGGKVGSQRRWLVRSSIVDAIDVEAWLARRAA